MSSSTIYTVGTALRRAQDNALSVSVLVEGHWLDGQVGGLDGEGLLLAGDDGSHAVVRLGSVCAVRVTGAAEPTGRPMPRTQEPVRHEADEPVFPVQREPDPEPGWPAEPDWARNVALAVVAAVAD